MCWLYFVLLCVCVREKCPVMFNGFECKSMLYFSKILIKGLKNKNGISKDNSEHIIWVLQIRQFIIKNS